MKRYGLILITALSFGCSHTTPPASIKSVTAVREGESVQVYFSLVTKQGKQTSATGTAHLLYELAVRDNPGVKNENPYTLIHEVTVPVTAEGFTDVAIGKGGLAHTEYAYNLGRLPYSVFGNPPKWVSDKAVNQSFGRIRLEFTQKNGGTFNGETKYTFD